MVDSPLQYFSSGEGPETAKRMRYEKHHEDSRDTKESAFLLAEGVDVTGSSFLPLNSRGECAGPTWQPLNGSVWYPAGFREHIPLYSAGTLVPTRS